MNDTTLTPTMPRPPTNPAELVVMDEPLRLKIFEVDHLAAAEIQKTGQQVVRNLSVNAILREAIHAGLPAVLRRYQAMLNVANNTK